MPSAKSTAIRNRLVSFGNTQFTIANTTIAAETSPAAIVLTTLAGEILYANQNFVQLLHLDGIESVVHADLLDVCREQLDLNFLTQLAKDGQSLFRVLQMRPEHGPMTVVCAAQRVTAESGYPKWLSIALIAKPGRSCDSVLTSPTGTVLTKLLGRFGTWSMSIEDARDPKRGSMQVDAAFSALMGCPHDGDRQALRDWLRPIYPEDRSRLTQSLSRLATTGGECSLQYRTLIGGVYRTLQTTACTVNVEGSPDIIVGVDRDVTEMTARSGLERTQLQLFRTLAESLDAPAFALDMRAQLLWCNAPFESLLELNAGKSWEGSTLSEVFPDAPTRRQIQKNFRHCMHGERRAEEIVLHSDATPARRYDLSFNPVMDDEGAITAVMIVAARIENRGAST